jgi:hypothetical protein
MSDESVRWSVVVKKNTDRSLRTRLAQRGLKKGDLSKFVEDAVNRALLMETVAEVREGFKDLTPEEIDDLVDEAVAAARSDRSAYARHS